MNEIEHWINQLNLLPHPEGGFFKEVYRSEDQFEARDLPRRFSGSRSASTAIYYMLTAKDFSAFHRIQSDEIWHFYAGDPLEIYVIHPDGQSEIKRLHASDGAARPMQIVPFGSWFAAKTTGAFTLSGCTVAPGFDFADFEMADSRQLIRQFPQHTSWIQQFTRT